MPGISAFPAGALDPTISQNMMVSWRRSAAAPVAVVGAVRIEDGAGVMPPATTLALHSEQNCLPQVQPVRTVNSRAAEQCRTCRRIAGSASDRGAGQCAGRLLPSGTSTLQPGHCKRPAPLRIFWQYRFISTMTEDCASGHDRLGLRTDDLAVGRLPAPPRAPRRGRRTVTRRIAPVSRSLEGGEG